MNAPTQRQKVLKATVALALYHAYRRVPREDEIERTYRLAWARERTWRGSPRVSTRQKQSRQVGLL